MKLAIVIDKDDNSDFCVYSPDIDGCIAVGGTKEEAIALYSQAVERYLRDLRETGQKPPRPQAMVETIEVSDIA
ncbi:MAG: type II toxin-antitoxin system HicB family antitoxin [Candidatus Sericytochromatia bacterium]|nr:type II toxin-antitoxin system HicB family antitoxin [Candidatus Tanganyikabacteria bacterium]